MAKERLPSKLSDHDVGSAAFMGKVSSPLKPDEPVEPGGDAGGAGCEGAEKLDTGAVWDTAKSVMRAALAPMLSAGIR